MYRNKIATENTKEREQVTDFGEWAEKVAAINESFEGRMAPDDNYHCCMIIGYNEKTQEFAVSDSWGASFELRWVPMEVANWAHNGKVMVIQP